MKFSSCFCFKRKRSTSNPTSSDTRSSKPDPVGLVTTTSFQPLPDETAAESDYHQVLHSPGSHRNSVGSVNNGPYARVKFTEPPQTSFDDPAGLYATVDKNRASRFNAAAANQQRLPSASSNQNPATPPPLYTNIATNSVNNRNSTHAESRAHYDELVVRESLKHRTERIQHEPERASDHYSSSTYGEHRKTNGSDLYAEIASGSGSGAYQPAGSLHEPGYATVTNRDEHRASSNSGSTHLHVHSSRF